jgi:hypothetical protein
LANSQAPLKELSPLAKLWSERLPSPLIPYDRDERRAVFFPAFTEMKDLIAKHETRLTEEQEKERTKASKQNA